MSLGRLWQKTQCDGGSALRGLFERPQIDPRRCIHLSIDCQRDFIAPAGYEAIAKATGEAVLPAMRDAGIPNIFVFSSRQDESADDPSLAMGGFYGVVPAAGEAAVHKTGYSGFQGSDLMERLQANPERDTLILTGFYLDECVGHTAMDAVKLGYTVYILDDCVGAVKDRQYHVHTSRALAESGVKRIQSEAFFKATARPAIAADPRSGCRPA